MKPEHDLRQADDTAATAAAVAQNDSTDTQNDSSDHEQSTTPSETLPDIEKGQESPPPEQVRTVTGFKVGGILCFAALCFALTRLTTPPRL